MASERGLAQTVKDNGDNILRNMDAETARYSYDSAKVILEKVSLKMIILIV